jgi:chromosome segregation ATPase
MSEENPSEDNAPKGTNVSDLDGTLVAINARKVEFDQLASSATTAIQQELDKAKAKLSEMEQLKTDAATAKGAINATLEATSADKGVVAQSKADIEALKSAATELSRKLDGDHTDITARISALREQADSLENVLTELSNGKAAAEADNQAAKTSVAEIGNTKAQFVNLANDTQAQYDGLVQRQNALQAKIEEIEDANNKITGLRRSLLESSDDAQSVQDQIGDLRAQIAAILEDVSNRRNDAVTAFGEFKTKTETESEALTAQLNKRFDSLHNTLQERILALLPSAGAAGLASTYYDAKSRYAPTSFAGRLGDKIAIGRFGWLRKWFGYNPASVVATVFFYALFGIPLLFIIYESVSLLFRI